MEGQFLSIFPLEKSIPVSRNFISPRRYYNQCDVFSLSFLLIRVTFTNCKVWSNMYSYLNVLNILQNTRKIRRRQHPALQQRTALYHRNWQNWQRKIWNNYGWRRYKDQERNSVEEIMLLESKLNFTFYFIGVLLQRS